MKISLQIFPKMPDMRYGYALLGLTIRRGRFGLATPED